MWSSRQGVDFKALGPAMVAGFSSVGVDLERFPAGFGGIG